MSDVSMGQHNNGDFGVQSSMQNAADQTCLLYSVQFQKISILTHHPPHPLGNSSLTLYSACKILTFKMPPLGISNDLPWGGYGFCMELHIKCSSKM